MQLKENAVHLLTCKILFYNFSCLRNIRTTSPQNVLQWIGQEEDGEGKENTKIRANFYHKSPILGTENSSGI